jgi:hypothetical protein
MIAGHAWRSASVGALEYRHRPRRGFDGEDAIGDVGEGVGKEPNVCADVDGNTAARHQLGKDREFRLARASPWRWAPVFEAPETRNQEQLNLLST